MMFEEDGFRSYTDFAKKFMMRIFEFGQKGIGSMKNCSIFGIP